MTEEASRKPRWPGGFCAVLMIYSPGLIAKLVLVGTTKAMLANEDHPNGHPPTHPDARAPHHHMSGLGSPARVSFDGYGASASRGQVELSMTCTTLRNRNQDQGCTGGNTALRRRTLLFRSQHNPRTPRLPTSTHDPWTLYIYKRRLATSTRRNITTKASWRSRWGEMSRRLHCFFQIFCAGVGST